MRRLTIALVLCVVSSGFISTPLQAQPALLGLHAPGQRSGAGSLSDASPRPQTERPLEPLPPAQLVLPAGTIIHVATTGTLSSDTQHDGDLFVAELQAPLVVDGWVVAQTGQTVMGRVAKTKKAGRVKGTSKLSLELQQIVLADGRQTDVKSEMVENSGPTSHGRDLAAVAITTGVGAAAGAVCGAKGAAIGAAAGATAGIAGVLLTRGEKVEISPEQPLTFRLAAPLTVNTGESGHAFWQVEPEDYSAPDRIHRSQAGPATVVVSKPAPRPVPLSVWPETQGILVGRPGHRECGI